jgi:hypothetical protein
LISCDLTVNPKQVELFNTVFESVAIHEQNEATKENWKRGGKRGKEPTPEPRKRVIHFGGAVRGGKTFGTFAILVLLAKKYPGFRAHVVRKSFPDLQRTSIPSMEKLLAGANVKWKRQAADYYVEFENGSRVYFMQQNIERDPDLNAFKGLETNVIVLEQLEELNEETYNKALERVGSWYLDPSAPAFVLTTFNPTYNWVKKRVYERATSGGFLFEEVFIEAFPVDNPFVTPDQWDTWELLDDETRERFIKGNWDIEIEGAFCYQFDDSRHLRKGLFFEPAFPVWLSFDFNVDPMTCIAFQTDARSWFRVVKEWRVKDGDTYEACRQIRNYFKGSGLKGGFFVTGDASGSNRMSGTRGAISHYNIILQELGTPLGLDISRLMVPRYNPYISDSRVFMNTALRSFPEFVIDPDGCPYLVQDLRFVLVEKDGEGKIKIAKTKVNKFAAIDNKELGHLLDCLRYGAHVTLHKLYSIPRS